MSTKTTAEITMTKSQAEAVERYIISSLLGGRYALDSVSVERLWEDDDKLMGHHREIVVDIVVSSKIYSSLKTFRQIFIGPRGGCWAYKRKPGKKAVRMDGIEAWHYFGN